MKSENRNSWPGPGGRDVSGAANTATSVKVDIIDAVTARRPRIEQNRTWPDRRGPPLVTDVLHNFLGCGSNNGG